MTAICHVSCAKIPLLNRRENMKNEADGFGVFVKDMEAMIGFYCDVLGFEIKESENTSNVYLEKDGTLFLFYGRRDFEIALGVENFDAVDRTFNEIMEKGGQAVMLPTTEPWGRRTCYIADPEGNLIEIDSFEKGKA